MYSVLGYLKKKLTVTMIIACVASIDPVSAVTLNFSAILVNGTCTLSLDKSFLPLGSLQNGQLRSNRIVNPQPFTLNVTDCVNMDGKSQIKVNGSGVVQDNKWLFRSPSTNVNGGGILVIRGNSVPDYNQTEVKDGDYITLVAESGKNPADQSFTFYAGASCGGSTGCANVNTGDISATLMFNLAYQ